MLLMELTQHKDIVAFTSQFLFYAVSNLLDFFQLIWASLQELAVDRLQFQQIRSDFTLVEVGSYCTLFCHH
jgi:hypothetical protein